MILSLDFQLDDDTVSSSLMGHDYQVYIQANEKFLGLQCFGRKFKTEI